MTMLPSGLAIGQKRRGETRVLGRVDTGLYVGVRSVGQRVLLSV